MKSELMTYESSLKYHRDLQSLIETARQQGIVEGRALEKIASAKRGLMKGYPITTIADLTNLPIAAIEKIKRELEK